MNEFVYFGTPKAGRLAPPEPGPWIAWLIRHNGKRVRITAVPEKLSRSTKQNSRYWSLIVPVAAEVLSAGREIPLSKDQAHYVLKAAFIGIEETALGSVPKSSKELSTAEFAEFCRKVEEWLLHTWGVIPEGDTA